MIQRIKILYGIIRRILRLPQYVSVQWFFDEQTCWMIYDSHAQVYVTGSLHHDYWKLRFRIRDLNEGIVDDSH